MKTKSLFDFVKYDGSVPAHSAPQHVMQRPFTLIIAKDVNSYLTMLAK